MEAVIQSLAEFINGLFARSARSARFSFKSGLANNSLVALKGN